LAALIAQVANFYGPGSGGVRTTVDALGHGYTAAGHDRVLLVPGRREADEHTATGRRITMRGLPVPGSRGHYHFFASHTPVEAALAELSPDRLEVSDRFTLHRLGRWARARGLPAVVIAHERIDAILAPRVPPGFPLVAVADRRNRRLVRDFDAVVCASAFGAGEFERIGARNVARITLGVDLTAFSPARAEARDRDVTHLVCVGRLSREKGPAVAIETLRRMHAEGVRARLTMIGDGPQRRALTRRAAGLPVDFTGAVDRRLVAQHLADADVALAPCRCETFGLAALEALACGTPVVGADQGALRELLDGARGAGLTAPAGPAAFAAAVRTVLMWPAWSRRAAARHRAEEFPWARTITAMLRVHGLHGTTAAAAA
jgi:alpha-1,6-mannosyltransferase